MRGLIVAAALALMAFQPATACDWTIKRSVDPMTDRQHCLVSSRAARISFVKRGADPFDIFVNSAYRRHGLQVRVDDHEAIYLGDNAYIYGPKIREQLLPQIMSGSRIRVRFDDYPHVQNGDAPICSLPQLLAECSSGP